jgi:hypothetical protein
MPIKNRSFQQDATHPENLETELRVRDKVFGYMYRQDREQSLAYLPVYHEVLSEGILGLL